MLPPTVYINSHVSTKALAMVGQKGESIFQFKEHIPNCIGSVGLKAFSSAISRGLDAGHHVDTLKSSKVIIKQSNSYLLKFVESIAIRRPKQDLCP